MPRKYTSEEPVVKIELTQGKVAIVDEIDGDLAELKWCYDPSGYGYVQRRPGPRHNRITIRIHRVILERMLERPLEKGEQVDHVNGNGLDNRRGNLRLATRAQNSRNVALRNDSTSGYKGVSWYKKTSKWRTQINIEGKVTHLGYFDTPEEAHEAYKQAAIKYHGEFARFE